MHRERQRSSHVVPDRHISVSAKSPWYPLDRRLGGPQTKTGHSVKEKNYQSPLGVNPDCPACTKSLYQLSCSSSYIRM